MNEKEFQEIKERCEKATPGPWKVLNIPYNGYDDPEIVTKDGTYICQTTYDMQSQSEKHNVDEDTEFIAHAREDILKLLREIEILRKAATCALDHIEGRRDRFSTRDPQTVVLILKQALCYQEEVERMEYINTPFSSGGEYDYFLSQNCFRCKKYDPDIFDGEIPDEEWNKRFCPVHRAMIRAMANPEEWPKNKITKEYQCVDFEDVGRQVDYFVGSLEEDEEEAEERSKKASEEKKLYELHYFTDPETGEGLEG